MDIQKLKESYVRLLSEKPVNTWSTDDAQLMCELTNDPDLDFLACISEVKSDSRQQRLVV
jgi:hypothetical protein